MKHRDDLVYQTAMFLEVSNPLIIFALAKLWFNKKAYREECEEELERWRRKGYYSPDVEQFCLDIMSGRYPVKWYPEKEKK